MFKHSCGPCAQKGFSARYINRGGEQTFAQPNTSTQSLLYAFVLEGAFSNLQQLCDRYLNTPAQGRVHYRPAMPFVLVTFGQNPELRSQDPEQKNIGFVSENEVAIWLLTMAGHQIGPFFWIDHLAWFMPYLFVDSSYAMATGREVYGYPKEWGWLDVPSKEQPLDRLSVEADVFETFSPETPAMRKPVIMVERMDRDRPSHLPRQWRSHQQGVEAIATKLLGHKRDIPIPGAGVDAQLILGLLTGAVPFVYLKQFRDIHDGRKPCYQAIVEANTDLKRFHGGGLLNHPFNMRINNFASHPIVSELGLGSYTPSIKLACWLEFDFLLAKGKEIIRIV